MQMQGALDDMLVFATVVEQHSFTGAAEVLNLTRARVSQIISRLERRLGIKLLVRTTRSLSLTDAGQQYFTQCVAIRELAERANSSLQQRSEQPQGVLTIAMPIGVQFIIDRLSEFTQHYPKLQIKLVESDRITNLVDKGIDVAIRVGQLNDSNLYASRVGEFTDMLCASPQYIRNHSLPTSPDQLRSLDWLSHGAAHGHKKLTLTGTSGQVVELKLRPRFVVGSVHSLKALMLGHCGFGIAPSFAIEEELKSGKLIRLLPDCHDVQVPIYAVYPEKTLMPVNTRTLVNFLKQSPISASTPPS